MFTYKVDQDLELRPLDPRDAPALFRLVDEIFLQRDLCQLASVPTAQVPFIPYSSPRKLKFLVWGMRSAVDQVLTQNLDATGIL